MEPIHPPATPMEEWRWSRGLHRLHCREDRCVFGCSCPCHPDIKVFRAAAVAIERWTDRPNSIWVRALTRNLRRWADRLEANE